MRHSFLLGIVFPVLLAAQDLPLPPLTLAFARSAAQQAALDQLLAEQRDPASANYHRWLSPKEFGLRFGPNDRDLARVTDWLASQGLNVESVASSRAYLTFRGSSAQIARAFGTEFRRSPGNSSQFSVSRAPRVPAELAPLVGGLLGFDNDYPKSLQLLPSSPDGGRSITPEDLAVIYNIAPLHRTGFDGSGVKIVIPASSPINPADLAAYRARFNLPAVKFQSVQAGTTPTPTGGPAQIEATLDVQLSGAVARNADLVLVHAPDVRIAFFQAIDQNLGNIISNSWGQCEPNGILLSGTYRAIIQQANAQGITVVSGSGDSGPANCDAHFESPLASKGNAAFLPSSVPESTSVGGTKLTEKDGPYWRPAPDFNGLSAQGYVPEDAWNDTVSTKLLSAGGGGPSVLFPRPNWQAGPGFPTGNQRYTPDVSFAASGYHNGYAIYVNGAWRVVGGTSASTPVFAGILGILNHYLVRNGALARPGLGNVNPALYRMAQVVPTAFHDVTTGDIFVPCVAGTADCVNGRMGYPAAAGYDLATGLGSLDVNVFVTRWDSSPAIATSLAVTPSTTTPLFTEPLRFDILVRASSAAIPTGTVTFLLASTPDLLNPSANSATSLGTATVIGAGGIGTATFTVLPGQLNPGRNTIIAVYSGSSNVQPSSTTLAVEARLPASGSAIQVQLNRREVAEESPNSDGFRWFFRVTLKELNNQLTTLSTFTMDGTDYSNQIRTFFGGTTIQASGSISANIGYRGITPPYNLRLTFGGQDGNGVLWSREVIVPLVARQQFTYFKQGGLVNGASFTPGLAPGALASAFGDFLSLSTAQAQALPLPTKIGGSFLTVNGVAAPFYYASPGQLNFQIPYETAPGNAVMKLEVEFANGQKETLTHTFVVSAVAPGIFAGPGNTLVPFSSGKRGDTLLAFITGDGALSPALATGTGPAPTTPLANLPKPIQPVRVTVGGVPANVFFAGVPPGLAGVTQINFTLAPNTPLGTQPVVVTVGSVASAPVNLTVSQ